MFVIHSRQPKQLGQNKHHYLQHPNWQSNYRQGRYSTARQLSRSVNPLLQYSGRCWLDTESRLAGRRTLHDIPSTAEDASMLIVEYKRWYNILSFISSSASATSKDQGELSSSTNNPSFNLPFVLNTTSLFVYNLYSLINQSNHHGRSSCYLGSSGPCHHPCSPLELQGQER